MPDITTCHNEEALVNHLQITPWRNISCLPVNDAHFECLLDASVRCLGHTNVTILHLATTDITTVIISCRQARIPRRVSRKRHEISVSRHEIEAISCAAVDDIISTITYLATMACKI